MGTYWALHGAVGFHSIERRRAMQDKFEVYAGESQPRPPAELVLERKAQIAREQAERLTDKERDLARQRSIDSAPEVRIALWEVRHGLALPRDAQHPLLQVIAAGTELDIRQVRDECRRRAHLRVAAVG